MLPTDLVVIYGVYRKGGCDRFVIRYRSVEDRDVEPPWLRQASPSNIATKCRFALLSARLRKLKRLCTALFRFARSNTHAHHNTRLKSRPIVMPILHETQMPQKAQVM